MEITALGHAGFRIRAKDVTIVIDPPSSEFGFSLKGITADIVCITHNHPGHNNAQGVGGAPRILRGPGEYEIGGALSTGLRAFPDNQHGAERGGNTIYIIHLEDITICHMGDLGHPLVAAQKLEVAGSDILMIPVGGHTTIDAKIAAEIIGEIEPAIVIPTHYVEGMGKMAPVPLDPVEKFYQVMGMTVSEPLTKLTVTRSTIPAQTQITLLTPRG